MLGRVGAQGPSRTARFRVAKVSRALMSVADMVDRGQKVIFDKIDGKDCSRSVDKASGIETPIKRVNMIYEFELHVAREVLFRGHCHGR